VATDSRATTRASSRSIPSAADLVSRLARIRLVLWEPQDPVNIGATVRVMKNMGLDDLVLVKPVRYDPDKLERIAHNTRDLAGRIVHADTLAAAIGDCSVVYAFAGKVRAANWPLIAPREMAERALVRIDEDPGARVALLFGREDHGLSNEALDQSTAVVTIPTTEHMSLNLAQAVLVAAYELHLAAADNRRRLPRRRTQAPPPSVEEREYAMLRIERALRAIAFLDTREPELVLRAVRALVGRAEPNRRELGMLQAMAVEVERTVERVARIARTAGRNELLRELGRAEEPVPPPPRRIAAVSPTLLPSDASQDVPAEDDDATPALVLPAVDDGADDAQADGRT
jgi:tRNA/rRNA methyltransferase/tRNA (cytidine32/uridine32-2'-O)-methyltransferase